MNKIETILYRKWVGMLARCKNKKGIKVCREWKYFMNFKNDMIEDFKEYINKFGIADTVICRKNNLKGYNKFNCKWSTK